MARPYVPSADKFIRQILKAAAKARQPVTVSTIEGCLEGGSGRYRRGNIPRRSQAGVVNKVRRL
jgi:hypothetical protein